MLISRKTCVFFRISKSLSSASVESWQDYSSIAAMYFLTADPFFEVLEVFSKAIYSFCDDLMPMSSHKPSLSTIPERSFLKGILLFPGLGWPDISAYDCTLVRNCVAKRQIALQNTSQTSKNGSAVTKYIPAVLRKSHQLVKLANLGDLGTLNQKHMFQHIKKK